MPKRKKKKKLAVETGNEAAHVGLVLLVLVGHESNPQHELLGVVVVEDAVEVLAKVAADLVRDLLHGQLLVRHALSIQLESAMG